MTRARDRASSSPTISGDLTVSGDIVPSTALSHRNMIINGDMKVAQRGTSETSISGSTTGYKKAPDRFWFGLRGAGTWTVSQSTESPEGFSNSYKLDCTTADASLDSNSYLQLQTRFEGQDLQHLKKGTSNAESFTVSFYTRTAKTGTYIVQLEDTDNARIITRPYTISSADTWERHSVTFSGDTTGALTNDNSISLAVIFRFVAGSGYTSGSSATAWQAEGDSTSLATGLTVNLADSTSNDFHLTGVQLELGSSATPFEHRSYGDELAKCMRYYEHSYNVDSYPAEQVNYGSAGHTHHAMSFNGTANRCHVRFKVRKRYTPNSVTIYSVSGLGSTGTGVPSTYIGQSWGAADSAPGVGEKNPSGFNVDVADSSAADAGSYMVSFGWATDAEL